MSYRDVTWCYANECKHFSTCGRAMTETVLKRAKQWWGGEDPPISFYLNPQQLSCYEANQTETSQQEEAGAR